MNNERIKFNVPKLFVFAVGNRGAGPAGYKCELHYHDELEFLIMNNGEYAIEVDGKEYFAKEGDVVFINSGVPHRTRAVVPSDTSLIQFKERDYVTSELSSAVKYSRKFLALTDNQINILKSPELKAALDEIIEENNSQKPANDFFIKSSIYKVLGLLYRLGILSNAEEMFALRNTQKILPVLSHINDHYDEDISLREVSDMLNFDESYFCRLFKKATGTTFTEYLNFVRVCKAEKLLNKTDNSILEISEAVGFSSVSYFNRIFKKYRHLSPRAYRAVLYQNI